MFSKACEYGIRASIHIAEQSKQGQRVSLKAIAAEIGSPVAFTAKILQNLVKNNIIQSVQGAYGGFEIQKDMLHCTTLGDIVLAIDGDALFTACGLGLKACNADKPCPVHNKFTVVRNELKSMLNSTSLHDLTLGLHEGLTFLKQ